MFSLIEGPTVKRRVTSTLRCMQTLSRVQSQIYSRRIRMSEDNQALQQQLLQKCARDLENLRVRAAVFFNSYLKLSAIGVALSVNLISTVSSIWAVFQNFFDYRSAKSGMTSCSRRNRSRRNLWRSSMRLWEEKELLLIFTHQVLPDS